MRNRATFEGKLMVDSPRFGTLVNDEFGGEISARVNERFKGTPAELVIPDEGAPIAYSNTFRLFAIDEVAREYGVRVMRPEEAQLLLTMGKLPEADSTYKDLGAVLDFSGQNHDLATRFYDSLPRDEKELDRFPAVLVGLGVEKSGGERYDGLVFVQTPHTIIRSSPALYGKSGEFEEGDSELLRTGVPSRVGSGERYLYTASQQERTLENLGISRFDLGRNRILYACVPYLAYANGDGRVVLISGGASAPDILAAVAGQRKSELLDRQSKLERLYKTTEEEAARIISGK